MDMDFATSCPLVRPALPRIRFLFVGSRLCSTLPSDGPSRFRPCALLVLHLHQVAQGTFTPKLSDMSDTQDAARRLRRCRRLCGGILDCRCARRSAKRQVGTKGWSFPIEQRDAAIDLNIRQRPLYMTNLLNLTPPKRLEVNRTHRRLREIDANDPTHTWAGLALEANSSPSPPGGRLPSSAPVRRPA